VPHEVATNPLHGRDRTQAATQVLMSDTFMTSNMSGEAISVTLNWETTKRAHASFSGAVVIGVGGIDVVVVVGSIVDDDDDVVVVVVDVDEVVGTMVEVLQSLSVS